MIGAVGELLGAVGVIVTLAYLARQIRQSRKASQQAAVAEVMDQAARFLSQIASSPEMARVWRLGMAADASLSVDELVQFRAFLLQLTYRWERLHHLDLAGYVDGWVAASSADVRRSLVGSPGFRTWFESRKEWISPEFRAVLQRDIAEAPDWELLGSTDANVSGRRPLGRGTA